MRPPSKRPGTSASNNRPLTARPTTARPTTAASRPVTRGGLAENEEAYATHPYAAGYSHYGHGHVDEIVESYDEDDDEDDVFAFAPRKCRSPP